MLGFKKKTKPSAPSLGGIIVILHHHPLATETDKYIKFTSSGKKYTAESLCWHAAVKLNIRPITFHLFALYCLDSNQWLASNDSVIVKDDNTQRFEFRMRLKLSPHLVRLLPSVDRGALDYLYFQCRHDFINDIHVGNNNQIEDGEQWAKRCIGLGLIDATCALFQANIPASQFNKHFNVKDFLAPVCIKEYSSPIQKTRLQLNFKENVEKKYNDYQKTAPDGDLAKLKIQFIIGGIYEYFSEYLVESFKIVNGDKLTIDPLRHGEAGIYSEDLKQVLVSIQDIMEIHIRPEPSNIIIQINRKVGMPEMLNFNTLEEARSFTSLLDKYYRMTEDYHVHVCKSVTSPMVIWMESAKCHGPVTGKWAISKLEEYNQDHEELSCNYLIKQVNRNTTGKPGQFWNLELVFRVTMKKPAYVYWDYKPDVENLWDCRCSLLIEGEPNFHNLEQLINYYTTESNKVIQLKRCLRPSQSKPVENRLLLCQRPSDSQSSTITTQNLGQLQSGVPAILQKMSITVQNVAQGKMTELHRGSIPAYNSEDIGFVAVKQLKNDHTDLLGMFTMSAHKACFWQDANIVRVRGICMAGPFSLVEEYAPLSNVSHYLCAPQEPVKVMHIVSVARQIASALYYLEENNEYHGNIRCKNLLVFSHTHNGMTVKLADPGMVFYFNSQRLEDHVNKERLPWLAPELYRNLNQMCHASDMFAFGMTLWEMFSSGVRPHDSKSSKEIMQAAECGSFLAQPVQCPSPVYDLMKRCWNPDPSDRITARIALRNINSVEMNADDREYARPEWESEPQCQEVLENRLNSAQIKRDNKVFLQQDMPLGQFTPENVNGSASDCDILAMNEQLSDESNVIGGSIQSRPLPPTPNDPLLIEESQLKKSHLLGSGYYGQVYLANYTKEGITKKVAVKSLNSEMYEKCVNEFEAEMKIMAKVHHCNIVSVIGKCPQRSETEPMLIVMEYVENGCLRDFLQRHKVSIHQEDLIRFAIDIASGMTYLCSQKIIHNDLAARNVLVTKDIPWRAKISDFGLAKLLPPEQYYYKQVPGKAIPAFWCAPEAIHSHKLSHKSDVWSYGITLWEIYSLGSSPHLCKEAGGLLAKLHKGDRLNTSKLNCPEGIGVLMKKCWGFKREDRPEFTEICETLCLIRGNLNNLLKK